MKTEQLVMVSLFTVATVLTVYFWMDRWSSLRNHTNEGFESNNDALSRIQSAVSAPPSDTEVNEAYLTLLRYVKSTPDKGLKFIFDIGDKFFDDERLKSDLDLARILDNYVPPLQKKR
jgi:hypothetical protein